MNHSYLSISELNRAIKSYFDMNPNLQDIYLKGEISNFKAHTSGHLYFSLKDETSRVKAIMFRNSVAHLKFRPIDGMNVLVHGKVSVYEANGDYQVYVDDMIEDGIGNLYIALEQLKEKLAKEGLFSKEHKKPIPKIPKKVGVVTAATGAAIKDIISTIHRRFPLCEIILFPSLVQGNEAAADISNKIKIADTHHLDVLIVGRGGGSIEDLWPFNEEIVARTIYHAQTPIISAVGHEIDFTISDFVADLRAPTPTAAAELAVPNLIDLLGMITDYQIRLNQSIQYLIEQKHLHLIKLTDSSAMKFPLRIYEIKAQKLDSFIDRAHRNIEKIIQMKWNHLLHSRERYILKNPKKIYEPQKIMLQQLLEKCELLNPINSIKRGYAVVKKDQKTISSISSIHVKDLVTVQLKDGLLNVEVKAKENYNGKYI